MIAREILVDAGAIVKIAENGAEAVAAVDAESFDAVLMDVHMPVMDGYDATRRIRMQQRFAELPIIAMTASATTQDREACAQAGMNAHVSKPIDVNELFGTLRRYVRASANSPRSDAQPATPTADTEPLPGIDAAAGIRRLGGRREAFHELLKVFADSTPDPCPQIERAVERGDTDRAAEMAHRLRGAAGNIAAARLAEVAAELETSLKRGTTVEHLLPQLKVSWAEVQEGLRRLAAMRDTEAPAQPDPAGVDQGLLELDALLSKDDAQAVTALRGLRGAFGDGTMRSRFAELEKRVSNYDFGAARQALRALRQELGLSVQDHP